MVKFICANSEIEAGRVAAEIMAEVIRTSPDALIGLATGSTPINMYSCLADMYRAGELSFKDVRSVNLDEYVGLPPTHVQSYAHFMSENLFSHVDIRAENCHIPSGTADTDAECERYDRLLDRLGRVDIQLLGIGHNGHIAFNEPDSHFPKNTVRVRLTDSTVEANSRFFASRDEVPTEAISMGIGRILRAKRILLLATGAGKADILERALFGRITPAVPASILQFYQGELTVVADRPAMSVILSKHPDVLT
ncbi:MAG: glucosamine-6-phosphate deaminase [Clostridia bacterium]|nr:glucosamine-6-phosphate deaminase [Clostridia bacterium]